MCSQHKVCQLGLHMGRTSMPGLVPASPSPLKRRGAWDEGPRKDTSLMAIPCPQEVACTLAGTGWWHLAPFTMPDLQPRPHRTQPWDSDTAQLKVALESEKTTTCPARLDKIAGPKHQDAAESHLPLAAHRLPQHQGGVTAVLQNPQPLGVLKCNVPYPVREGQLLSEH